MATHLAVQHQTETSAAAYIESLSGNAWSGIIYRSMKAILHREPELDEFRLYGELLGNGADLKDDFITRLMQDDAFLDIAQDPDPSSFIVRTFQHLFGQMPEAPEIQSWTERMTLSGASRQTILNTLINSPESIRAQSQAIKDWFRLVGPDDVLDAGAGVNTLSGGILSDTFVIDASTPGTHRIVDLEPWDSLEFLNFGYVDAAEVLAYLSDADDDVIFGDQFVTVIFANTDLATVSGVLANGPMGVTEIYGTSLSESLAGTAGTDIIHGLGGNDWITPSTGNDTIEGGSGWDMVSYVGLPELPDRPATTYRLVVDLEATEAFAYGGNRYELNNVERATGTIFADYIRGDAGANQLRGSGDYDWFIATTGPDTIDGGTGQDMISFVEWQNAAANVIGDPFGPLPPTGAQATGIYLDLANPGNSTGLAAGLDLTSVERITGSGRQDVFFGDGNENDFRGLGDFDWFVSSDGGRERYFGGDGVDTVTYYNAPGAVAASLRNGATVNGQETGYGTQGWAARDLYFEIENLVGSAFGDSLTGNNGRNQLNGLGGDDMLFGFGNIDYLKGGAGNDTLNGGGSSDYALFDGNRDAYAITRTSSNEITVDGPNGTDSLIDVEYLLFGDGQVTIWELAVV